MIRIQCLFCTFYERITWQIHKPTPKPKTYVLVLATGVDVGSKRATLAFSAACPALAMDMLTHVFSVPIFDGAVFKHHVGVEIRGLTSLLDYAAGVTTISF